MRSKLLRFGLLLVLVCGQVTPVSGADLEDPQAFITRGDVLMRLLDAREQTKTVVDRYRNRLPKLPLFTDIRQSDPIAPYAEAAFATGLTVGFSDRTLRPDGAVPAEEAVALIMREFRQPGEPAADDHDWFAPYIRVALRKRIIPHPESMGVGQAVTRGEFAQMLDRMSMVASANLESFPEPVPVVQPMVVRGPGAAPSVGAREQRAPIMAAQASGDHGDFQKYASSQNFAITIPALGIRNLTVTHPQDTSSKGVLEPLQNGVGHLFSYPGNGGKIMIYGHSSGYSWDPSKFKQIFTKINKLKSGDKIYVTYRGNLYIYSVTGQKIVPPNESGIFAGAGEQLILYTCWPPKSIKERLAILASPVQTVALR